VEGPVSRGEVAVEIGIQLAAVLLAFALGFVFVLAFGFDPIEVYGVLLAGAAGSFENLAWSVQNATPLVFTGLSVALAFRAGLFNIGAEGQLIAGAFCAGVVGWAVPALAGADLAGSPFWTRTWYPWGIRLVAVAGIAIGLRLLWVTFETPAAERPPGARAGLAFAALVAAVVLVPWIAGPVLQALDPVVLVAALAAAAGGGALWALGPAWLRAHLGVSEVISTIMFNFLAALLASWLLTTAAFKEPGAIPQTPAVAERARLSGFEVLLPDGPVRREVEASQLNTGFVLALAVAAGVAYLLWRTTMGYELRAVGANAAAAEAQGIDVRRNVVTALALSGALAGLGGAEQVLGVHHHFVKDFWIGLGFTGIAVALVGRNHPAGVVAAALLFGALQNGAVEIDMMTLFPRELILVLQALIIFLVSSGPMIRELVARTRARARAPAPARGDGGGGPGK
jgi:simple sugar transport system permease protein